MLPKRLPPATPAAWAERLLLPLGLLLWASALPSIDLAAITDLGLISVLPIRVPIALVLILASAAWQIRKPRLRGDVMALHLAALILVIYGTPILIEEETRFAPTYIHVGISEYISRTGTVAPQLEARFDWPGFFILASFLTAAGGLTSAMDLAPLAPIYLNLLYLGPLALVFRSITTDVRLVWAGLYVFELTNWIGQDYFSPQGLNYFLFLTILGLVLTYFRVSQPSSPWLAARLESLTGRRRIVTRLWFSLIAPVQSEPEAASRGQLAAITILMVVIFGFVALSHQLTPFFTVMALLFLVVFNRIAVRALPILMGVIAVTWVSYMTVPFLSGHVALLLSEFGQIGRSVSSNVTNRVAGSADHQTIVMLGMVLSVGLWLCAALGFLLRFRDGRRDLSMALLIAAPVPLVAAQAYGGEMVLRLYLFTAPFMAILAAGAAFRRPTAVPSVLKTGVMVVVASLFAVGLITTRYGNERMDLMTTAEVEGLHEFYTMAPYGSLLITPNGDLPWRDQAFEEFEYRALMDNILLYTPDEMADLLSTGKGPAAYLILTASEEAEAEIFFGLPPERWDHLIADLTASTRFVLVYDNAGLDIFQLIPTAGAGG
jgi:hypothetical protein